VTPTGAGKNARPSQLELLNPPALESPKAPPSPFNPAAPVGLQLRRRIESETTEAYARAIVDATSKGDAEALFVPTLGDVLSLIAGILDLSDQHLAGYRPGAARSGPSSVSAEWGARQDVGIRIRQVGRSLGRERAAKAAALAAEIAMKTALGVDFSDYARVGDVREVAEGLALRDLLAADDFWLIMRPWRPTVPPPLETVTLDFPYPAGSRAVIASASNMTQALAQHLTSIVAADSELDRVRKVARDAAASFPVLAVSHDLARSGAYRGVPRLFRDLTGLAAADAACSFVVEHLISTGLAARLREAWSAVIGIDPMEATPN